MQHTLCLIKPDAVKRHLTGEILAMIQNAGLQVTAIKMLQLTKDEAGKFYAVHKDRPFFTSLTEYMTSGPLVAVALKGENAVVRYRELMGATNPSEAKEGTIRKKYAESLEANSVHGSDAVETAAVEIPFFFSTREIVG